MHTLLIRQLKSHRHSTEIPEDWKEFISAVDRAYIKADEDYGMMENSFEYTSNELIRRNQELNIALKELKEAETQLIQAAKMAALGQLISGIAHEINTPAGAITGAIQELEKGYNLLLAHLLELAARLNKEEMEKYLIACTIVREFKKNIDIRERRLQAHAIEKILVSQQVTHGRFISKKLASVGFCAENVKPILPLVCSEHYEKIVQSLFDLGMAQIHVYDIHIAIGRITQIVKALKLYAHTDQNPYVSTNLQEDLNNTLIILNNRIKRAITVKKEFENIPIIKCYADQLNQVWTNLINNSIEAMAGEGQIILRLKKCDETHIMVEVEDNGPGIPPEVLPRIFEPYFTTKPKGEGTGLGLSICRDIVRKQHGDITVTTEPGRTIFKVTLPMNIPEAEVVEVKQEEEPNGNGKRA